MLLTSHVLRLFEEENFKQFSLLPNGSIILTVAGCLHGKADTMFGDYCLEIKETITIDDGCEHWQLIPNPSQRAFLASVFVSAWRVWSAALDNPYFTISNCYQSGWGTLEGKNTTEQAKTMFSVALLGHSARVASNQSAILNSDPAMMFRSENGDIALEIDGKPWVISPSGYLYPANVEAFLRVEETQKETQKNCDCEAGGLGAFCDGPSCTYRKVKAGILDNAEEI